MNPFKLFRNLVNFASHFLKENTTLDLTSWIIFLISVSGFLIIFFGKKFFASIDTNLLSALVLWITAIAIFKYTRETRDLKDTSQKQLNQTRAQSDFEVMPFLRLQLTGWRPDGFLYLVNDGRGLAKNIQLKARDSLGEHKIKDIPVIAAGPNNPSGIDIYHIDGISPTNLGAWHELAVNDCLDLELYGQYQDFCGRNYFVHFKYNSKIKDSFEILRQEPKGWHFGQGF